MDSESAEFEVKPMSFNKVVIMIPALNEEDSIGEVIENVPIDDLILMGYDPRIAVVDGEIERIVHLK